jgi:hypothetical protein
MLSRSRAVTLALLLQELSLGAFVGENDEEVHADNVAISPHVPAGSSLLEAGSQEMPMDTEMIGGGSPCGVGGMGPPLSITTQDQEALAIAQQAGMNLDSLGQALSDFQSVPGANAAMAELGASADNADASDSAASGGLGEGGGGPSLGEGMGDSAAANAHFEATGSVAASVAAVKQLQDHTAALCSGAQSAEAQKAQQLATKAAQMTEQAKKSQIQAKRCALDAKNTAKQAASLVKKAKKAFERAGKKAAEEAKAKLLKAKQAAQAAAAAASNCQGNQDEALQNARKRAAKARKLKKHAEREEKKAMAGKQAAELAAKTNQDAKKKADQLAACAQKEAMKVKKEADAALAAVNSMGSMFGDGGDCQKGKK